MSIKTVLRLVVAASIGLVVASCQDQMQSGLGTGTKHLRPLKPEILALMETKGMRKEDPILVRAFKDEKTLEVWKRDRSGRYALLKSYPLCTVGGGPGPKFREGDKQSPEGFYTVAPWRMNPNSQYHLSYDVGYPNAFDKAWGRTGAAIMVHGGCTASAGCFIATDEQVEEIYGLAREAFSGGQKAFQVQAYPFRMTAENLAKHRKSPHFAFWKNIKQGYDHFEVTKLEPRVEVCDKRYVFDPRTTDPTSTAFNPTGACPAFEVPHDIAQAVAEKAAADDKAFKVAVAELDEADHKEQQRVMVAEAREKEQREQATKPTKVAGWFGGSAATAAEEAAALAMTPVPVAVPLPKPSPNAFATSTQVAAVEPGMTTRARGAVGGLFGFGASEPAPVDPAAAAVIEQPIATTAAVRPVAVPLPAARPDALQASVGPAEVPAPAPEEKPPVWKKLNPFGG